LVVPAGARESSEIVCRVRFQKRVGLLASAQAIDDVAVRIRVVRTALRMANALAWRTGFPTPPRSGIKEWNGVTGSQSLILARAGKRLRAPRGGRTNLDRDRARVTIETG
jgi:hypothetical protein